MGDPLASCGARIIWPAERNYCDTKFDLNYIIHSVQMDKAPLPLLEKLLAAEPLQTRKRAP